MYHHVLFVVQMDIMGMVNEKLLQMIVEVQRMTGN